MSAFLRLRFTHDLDTRVQKPIRIVRHDSFCRRRHLALMMCFVVLISVVSILMLIPHSHLNFLHLLEM